MEIVLVLLAVTAGLVAFGPVRQVLRAGLVEWAAEAGASVAALVVGVLVFAFVVDVVVRGAPHP